MYSQYHVSPVDNSCIVDLSWLVIARQKYPMKIMTSPKSDRIESAPSHTTKNREKRMDLKHSLTKVYFMYSFIYGMLLKALL